MTSPNVTVYRNGDVYFPGVRLVINKKQIRTFDCFLDKVTHGTRSKVAIRSICTPSHGHRVNRLEQLESGGVYVALGAERFKKLEYSEIQSLPTSSKSTKPRQSIVKPVVHSRVVVSARCKKAAALEPLANKIIYVYRNGDSRHPGTKLLLNKRLLCDMEKTLQYVTDKINLRSGAVRGLYTVDGHSINSCEELQSGLRYVAVGFGARFIRIAYTEGGVLSLTPQRGVVFLRKIDAAARDNGQPKGYAQKLTAKRQITGQNSKCSGEYQDHSLSRTQRKLSKKDYSVDASESQRRHSDSDQPFHSIDTTGYDLQQAIQSYGADGDPLVREYPDNDLQIEDDTVYRASGINGEKAAAVHENQNTKVEKPVDMVAAEEVDEEIQTNLEDTKTSNTTPRK